MESQCKRIVDYINRFGSITALQSFVDLGCTQLAARIYDLHQKGYEFKTTYISLPNRYGEPVSFKKYEIVGYSPSENKDVDLKEALKAKNMTYKDLAARLKDCGIPVDKADISKMFYGTYQAPKYIIREIEQILGLSPFSLKGNRNIK